MRPMDYRIKLNSFIIFILTMLFLTGCSSSEAEYKVSEDFSQEMAGAHFLSAKKTADDIQKEMQLFSDPVTDYDASCCIWAEGNGAYLVLGDREGEYGRLFMLGAVSLEDGSKVIVKNCIGGKAETVSEYELGSPPEDQTFKIKISVSEGKAVIRLGNMDLGSEELPFDSLGCVGVYKDRGQEQAIIDDIKVESSGGLIFADDFDGHFVNSLYPYDYYGEATGAFSPFFYRTVEYKGSTALDVASGLLLSETQKDSAEVFKRDFEISAKKVESAYLAMTALGSFDVELNSRKVNSSFFDPGKMVFDRYLNYVIFDVKDYLQDTNDLRIYLFHGFFDRGNGYPEVTEVWGEDLAVKGVLVINYTNGERKIIPTDEKFLVSRDTRYRFADVYHGEIIDDRYEEGDITWRGAEVDQVSPVFFNLPCVAKENESIKAYKYLDPVSVTEPVPGHFVYDFGENIAGILQIDLEKAASIDPKEGQVVTFRYGELLNSDSMVNPDGPVGSVWTQNLLSARNTDYYVYGKENRKGEVSFFHTYHGFRYVEITGVDKAIPPETIKAVAISSDVATTGEFTCSNETVNRFYENSVRSLKSNMMDVPTDCCQRDERLGWTGDAQAVSAFAMYQFDAKDFYRNYLKEIRSLQADSGKIYDVAPSAGTYGGHSCWGDAIVTITWNAYLQYGDKAILTENIEAATDWVDYLVGQADDYLLSSDGYGDHLSSQGIPEQLNDTAWCAHSAKLLSGMYAALGNSEASDRYAAKSDMFIKRWQQEFIDSSPSVEGGILKSECESETAYALGLAFGLFPKELELEAAERLKLLTEYGGYLFYPGYSGMEFYLPSLCEYGYADMAASVMTNDMPGGLANPQSMGLTTNPEKLSAFRFTDPDGETYPDGKYYVSGSLNHAAYSCVSELCYRYILGIQPDPESPGYEHFFIKPCVMEEVESASGSYDSVRGKISVSLDGGRKELSCVIPDGSTCTLVLPGGEEHELTSGEYSFNW